MKVRDPLENRKRIDKAIYMRFDEVQKKIPYSKTFIHRLMCEHKFSNLHVTPNKTRVWIKKEIDDYVKKLENEKKQLFFLILSCQQTLRVEKEEFAPFM